MRGHMIHPLLKERDVADVQRVAVLAIISKLKVKIRSAPGVLGT